jgi:transcriptional regulator of acetoin/glycerol metabolism
MPSIKELKRAREQERLQAIRAIVDDVARRIENQTLGEAEARNLVANVRFQVSLLIPEQMETYDLIYGSRFERLIQQFICGKC